MAGDTAVLLAPLYGNAVDELRRAFNIELAGRIVGAVFGIRRRVIGHYDIVSGVMHINGLCGHTNRVQQHHNGHQN